jgi:hypothetical protein
VGQSGGRNQKGEITKRSHFEKPEKVLTMNCLHEKNRVFEIENEPIQATKATS